MSQLSDIVSAQKSLEECFTLKMQNLEAQIQGAGAGKETVAKVAEEFRTFRELMYSMLGLLRRQINECASQVDAIETKHRRKALIFLGVAESSEKEDCRDLILGILQTKLGLKDTTKASIAVCHRLGVPNGGQRDQQRPVLVRFSQYDVRAAVWRAKTGLKGTSISVKEFLTRPRQNVFNKARLHFGVRSCWTQDGVILIKTSDGKRHRIVTSEDLESIVAGYPVASSSAPVTRRFGP